MANAAETFRAQICCHHRAVFLATSGPINWPPVAETNGHWQTVRFARPQLGTALI